MVREIFRGMKQLKKLYLVSMMQIDNFNMHRLTCTNEGIKGIPLGILNMELLNYGLVDEDNDRVFPFIGDLKELENFTMESWHDYGSGITDFSVIFGLIHVPKLKRVHLHRTLISRSGIEMLQNKIGVEYVREVEIQHNR